MPGLASRDLEALRQKIAALEKRPLLAEGASVIAQKATCRVAANDTRPRPLELLSAPAGVLHEIFADELQHNAIGLGFALGQARSLITSERQSIIYLQLTKATQELGLPYAIGLSQFGIAPERLVIGRVETLAELFWAMEEAIACRAVAGVIADIVGHPKALDFTVSRRLSLRTSDAGTSAFVLRYGPQREASAAKLRWWVGPHQSAEHAFDALSPGPLRFQVKIEKRRLGSKTQNAEGKSMIVNWTENGFVPIEPGKAKSATRLHHAAPLPGAFAPLMGDRLPKAG